MSTFHLYVCDGCGNRAEVRIFARPEGWIAVAQPSRADYCSWACTPAAPPVPDDTQELPADGDRVNRNTNE